MDNSKLKRKDLVHPDLSYKIIGILFEVWTKVGYGHKESFYQKAVAKSLKDAGLKFREQLPVKVRYKDEPLGEYHFDFLIEDKIVLELKVKNYFAKTDIEQLYSYLKAINLKLGILAHFTHGGVKSKRILNLK